MSNDEATGLVVAAHGRQVIVENSSRERFNCRMKGRRIRPVCGDYVYWTPMTEDTVDGVVTGIAGRTNLLQRPTRRGRDENVAANLTRMVVVFATQPPADPFLVDRYIAAAEHLQVECVLVHNKYELADNTDFYWIKPLENLGYKVVRCSAKTGSNVEQLTEVCTNGISILVGQSGVGKSSLLNAMIPGIGQETQEISTSGKFGRHTTSASYLFHFPEPSTGGLIDSPGVRDFAPPTLSQEQVPNGYIEIFAAASDCRFANCRHEHEPQCAVKMGVESGKIEQRRYTSYLQLMALMRELQGNLPP
ncbi:MAG: ribosome small subunit-dependent GTPase A [Gammaproteobacteria bacterium]